MPRPGGYSGLYRLFENQDWRSVCDKKTRVAIIFPTASAAIAAAKEVVKLKLNPHLVSETIADKCEEDPDVLQIDEWRKQQQEEYARSRATVKNGKRHRQVVVEVRKRKVKA